MISKYFSQHGGDISEICTMSELIFSSRQKLFSSNHNPRISLVLQNRNKTFFSKQLLLAQLSGWMRGGGVHGIWGTCLGTFMVSRPTLSCSHWWELVYTECCHGIILMCQHYNAQRRIFLSTIGITGCVTRVDK